MYSTAYNKSEESEPENVNKKTRHGQMSSYSDIQQAIWEPVVCLK